jgi:hypothetical protein
MLILTIILFKIGLDQRKLFIAAKEWLPKLGYRQVCYCFAQSAFSQPLEADSRLASTSHEWNGARHKRRQNELQ